MSGLDEKPVIGKIAFFKIDMQLIWFSYFRTGSPQRAEGNAVLNNPSDPQKPGELIVNFDAQPSFSKKF